MPEIVENGSFESSENEINLNKITHNILNNLSIEEPWDEEVIEMLTEVELLSNGFRIFSKEMSRYWVKIEEDLQHKGWYIVSCQDFYSGFPQSHTSTTNEGRIKQIYDQVISSLLK